MICVYPEEWEKPKHDLFLELVARESSGTHLQRIPGLLEQLERPVLVVLADGIGHEPGWLLVSDHVRLFGDGPLVAARKERRELSEDQFPGLRGMYLSSPDGPWRTGIAGAVPDWALATPAELDCLGVDVAVSGGVLDEAILAAAGGARVALLVRVSTWESLEASRPPLRQLVTFLDDSVSGGPQGTFRGGEER